MRKQTEKNKWPGGPDQALDLAQLLDVSKPTVDRELRFVRGWLFERLRR